jgi:hypothetical protein
MEATALGAVVVARRRVSTRLPSTANTTTARGVEAAGAVVVEQRPAWGEPLEADPLA